MQKKLLMFSSIVLVFNLFACGKLDEAQDDRDDANRRASDLDSKNKRILKALESIQSTENYYWLSTNVQVSNGEKAYESSERFCKEISYSLPSRAALEEYFATYLPSADASTKSAYYMAGEPRETLGYVLCVLSKSAPRS